MFANLLFKLAGKLLGPKVLMGLTVASVLGLVAMGAFTVHTLNEASASKQKASQLREALAEATGELDRALDERDELNKALKRKHDREKVARARMRKAERALEQLESQNDDDAKWAGEHVPADIARWLRGNE